MNAKKIFLEYIDKDANSFDEVMQAFGMPKDTDEQKKARSAAIQAGMKNAAAVPLAVAKGTVEIMPLIKEAVAKGNSNAVTDAAVAGMQARTAVLGALYNVKINLGSIKDEEFVAKVSGEVAEIEKQALAIEAEIISIANSKL